MSDFLTQSNDPSAAPAPDRGGSTLLATSWYPEQWPRGQWAGDLALMRRAGIQILRVADFSWASLEPSDDRFTLDWLADAIELAGGMGFRMIVATPTAAPPVWLTTRHPEILRQNHEGVPDGYMGRCHFRHASSIYHGYTARIARVLAERFGPSPHVVGWQIDNEYTGFSHDPETGAAFAGWLRDEYGTLDELNRRLGLAYWGRQISDWSEIPGHFRSSVSPSLLAAFRRFVTHTIRAYQAVQLAELRPRLGPGQFVSHNFHVSFHSGDNTLIARDLDQVLFDYYPELHHDAGNSGWWFALARGLKRQNFWLIETQAGAVKYLPVNAALARGVTRALCWHAIGMGSDLVGFWQWRPCTGGQEQYWGTLVGPSGQPRPIFEEISEIGAEFARHRAALTGTNPVYQAALFYCDEDRWMIDHDRFHHAFGSHEHLASWHAALRAQGLGVEVIDPSWPLAGHRLAIASGLSLLTPEREDALLAWVGQGGHLVIGPRSFNKNRDGAWLTEARAPGTRFAEAGGAEIVEFYALESPVSVAAPWGTVEAAIWAEWLDAPDAADVVARYGPEHSWLAGNAAITSRACGEGRLTMLGFWPSADAFPDVIGWLAEISALPINPLPAGVALHHRRGDGRDVFIAINHSPATQSLRLPAPSTETLTLAPQAVEIRTSSNS